MELAEEKPVKRSIITVEELTEIERLEDLDTCMVRHSLWPHHYLLHWICYCLKKKKKTSPLQTRPNKTSPQRQFFQELVAVQGLSTNEADKA